MTLPAVGLYNCNMARPVVLLPQPDSPTRPSVSPRLIKKSRPSTACTAPTVRCTRIPFVMGKCIFRPSTFRRISPDGTPVSPAACERASTPMFGFVVVSVVCIYLLRFQCNARLLGGYSDSLFCLLAYLECGLIGDVVRGGGLDVYPAGDIMSGTYAAQWGHLLAVARLTVGTARIEGAPRWWVDHIGWHTGDRVQPFLAYLVEAGHRLQEAERVR